MHIRLHSLNGSLNPDAWRLEWRASDFPHVAESSESKACLSTVLDSLKDNFFADDQPHMVSLWIPTEWVTYQCAFVPRKQHTLLKRAAAFELEPFLASDLSSTHVVAESGNEDALALYAIDHDLMSSLIIECTRVGLSLLSVYPDTLPVSGQDDTLSIVIDPERVLVAQSSRLHSAAPLDLLSIWLEQLSLDQIHTQSMNIIIDTALAESDAADALTAWATTIDPNHTPRLERTRELWWDALDQSSPLLSAGLMQGDFEPDTLWRRVRYWQPVALAVAACWLIICVTHLGLGWMYDQRSLTVRDQQIAQYQQYFPDAQSVSDPVKQLRSKVSGGNTASTTRRVDGLGAFAVVADKISVLPTAEATRVRRLHFATKSRSLDLILSIASVDALEQLTDSLTSAGHSVKIESARDADGTVMGEISMQVPAT